MQSSLRRRERRTATIGANGSVPTMFAGQKRTSRRRTNRRAGEQIVEANALFCHAIQIWGLDLLAPHEPRFVVTEFIRHDVNDVGLSGMSLACLHLPLDTECAHPYEQDQTIHVSLCDLEGDGVRRNG